MTFSKDSLQRRRWLTLAGAGMIAALAPTVGWTDDDNEADDEGDGSGTNTTYLPATTGLKDSVVIVGGGMAGATAAKYLRLWGGAGLTITLVDPVDTYTSNIMSNLVLNGSRTLDSLNYTRNALASKYNIKLVTASVTALDTAGKTITLSNNTSLTYDRVVLAPGIEFEDAYGLKQADYDNTTPHAWQAGAQTALLADQINVMSSNNGVFVMTIPMAPYRCPPGPYERACLVADFLKNRLGSAARVIILDENTSSDADRAKYGKYGAIQAEKENFSKAFGVTYAGVIDYQSGVTEIKIDPSSKVVTYIDSKNDPQTINAAVVNPIVPQRARGSQAGDWLAIAGLNNSGKDSNGMANGKWCVVDVLSYESTAKANVHIIGDASSCGLPKAGHVANQEAKICADAIVRLFSGQQPDPAPVANSACYSPITATTASWLTAVYQYEKTNTGGKMVFANKGGQTVGAMATEAAAPSTQNFRQMNTWFNTLMGDSFA
ncbi:MAG: hypothetical protein RLZZ591_2714 [Pseudomonadota bacterium]|jgi:NADPH-dependent 2,4-dienoyl-CoA reductase/sulfur reductase-like enzyme